MKGPIGIPDFATTIAVMLGLGAGIDYALLIFSRFREQLARGDSAPEAAARANATSGTSVVAAGLIVMVAIAGLLAVGIPLIGKMGLGVGDRASAAVVVSSITVLPIFAGALAKRAAAARTRRTSRSPSASRRWGRRIVRRPAVPLVIGGAHAHHPRRSRSRSCASGQPDDGNHAAGRHAPRGATTSSRRPSAPASTARCCWRSTTRTAGSSTRRSSTPLGADAEEGAGRRARSRPRAQQGRRRGDPDRDADDVAAGRGHVDAASTAPRATRSRRRPRRAGLKVYVGGQTAGFEDFSDKISARLPVFIAIVIGLSILLLIAVFRSIWVPLASAVFNLLSIGAAYGVIVAVFQWGWGASLLGVDGDAPIVSFVPMMMFAILFGLSMDYNVFLLSRIQRGVLRGRQPDGERRPRPVADRAR